MNLDEEDSVCSKIAEIGKREISDNKELRLAYADLFDTVSCSKDVIANSQAMKTCGSFMKSDKNDGESLYYAYHTLEVIVNANPELAKEASYMITSSLKSDRNNSQSKELGNEVLNNMQKYDLHVKIRELRKLKELRKMTKGIQEGMDKSTPIKEVDADAPFNVVATKAMEEKGR